MKKEDMPEDKDLFFFPYWYVISFSSQKQRHSQAQPWNPELWTQRSLSDQDY